MCSCHSTSMRGGADAATRPARLVECRFPRIPRYTLAGCRSNGSLLAIEMGRDGEWGEIEVFEMFCTKERNILHFPILQK